MNDKHSENTTLKTWFGKWFLDNKVSIFLINSILVFLLLFIFNQVSYIFDPVTAFIGAVFPAVFVAAVQYYLMNPLVDFFEKKFKVPRVLTIIVLFIVVIGIILWAMVSLIPIIQSQVQSMISEWPKYWDSAEAQVNEWLHTAEVSGIKDNIQQYIDQIQNSFGQYISSAISETLVHISTAVNVITMIFVTLLTAPFILFFMLKDGRQIKDTLAKFFPNKYRKSITELLSDINQSIASYVRGQLTVAFWVGVMFAIGYSIVGLDYAITLAVSAAILNLVPYFGTFIALIPALIIALFDSTGMLIKVLIVFAIEQTVESRLISPLVLGNKMEMHPVTTIIVLIGASAISGIWGVIFAIPVYAVLKIIFQRLFDYYRVNSGLYEEDLVAEQNNNEEPPIEDSSQSIQK